MHPAGIFVFGKGRRYDGCRPTSVRLRNQVNTFGRAAIDEYLPGRYLVVIGNLPGQAFGQHIGVAIDTFPLTEQVFFQPGRFTTIPDVCTKISADLGCVAVSVVAMSVEHKSGFD
jgi:hypothetical protein